MLLILLALVTTLPVSGRADDCTVEFGGDDESAGRIGRAVDRLIASGREAEQIAAVETIFNEGRRALNRGQVSRTLHRTLKSIMPALFSTLHNGEGRARRAAAFALAGLIDSKVIDDLSADLHAHFAIREERVRMIIESYLHDRGTQFIQYLHVNEVIRHDGGWRIFLTVEIKDELPVLLNGRAPLIRHPEWLALQPKLEVVVHEVAGRVYRSTTTRGRGGPDFRLAATFAIHLPPDADPADLGLFFDFTVDDHALERITLRGDQLLNR